MPHSKRVLKALIVVLAFNLAGWLTSARADNQPPSGGFSPPPPPMGVPSRMQGNQEGARGGEGPGACQEDVEKYCKEVQPGEGRVAGCLKQHQAELSRGCQSKMTDAKEKLHGFTQACQKDLAQYCKEVQPGEGRLVHCLHEHHDQLSGSCKQAMESMHHQHPGGAAQTQTGTGNQGAGQ